MGDHFARVRAWLDEPTDSLPLVVFRVVFGLLMLFIATRFVLKGWVETQYLTPSFHFRYFLFDWVRPLPGDGLYLVFALQIGCGLLIALGWHYRPAAWLFLVAFTYVELLDQTTYLNHYYFISLAAFLLAVLPLHHWRSVDALQGRIRNAGPPRRWIVLAIQLQLVFVYLFAGLAKLNPDWLLEAQPLRIWLAARSGYPVVGGLFDQTWFAFAMSWGGAAFDLAIPFLLFWRRSRPYAYIAVMGFHAATGLLFPIGVFPLVMVVGTLVFFDRRDYDRLGEGLRRWTRRWSSRGAAVATSGIPTRKRRMRSGRSPGRELARRNGVARWLVPAFFALQVLVAVRHLAYPGPVLWTEEGYRFSWRVMLAEKTGTVFYHIRDPLTGHSWEAVPGDYLTPQQEKQFAYQPDMILGFAHHLRDSLTDQLGVVPEIRAEAHVSLNGRASKLLVDPTVDLARVTNSLAPKGWILSPP